MNNNNKYYKNLNIISGMWMIDTAYTKEPIDRQIEIFSKFLNTIYRNLDFPTENKQNIIVKLFEFSHHKNQTTSSNSTYIENLQSTAIQ